MKLTSLSMLFLPLLAVATPAALVGRTGAPSQPTVACCDTTVDSLSKDELGILGLLGGVIEGVTGVFGLQCSPITLEGIANGGACNSAPVSCTNGIVGGIGIGCAPITF